MWVMDPAVQTTANVIARRLVLLPATTYRAVCRRGPLRALAGPSRGLAEVSGELPTEPWTMRLPLRAGARKLSQ